VMVGHVSPPVNYRSLHRSFRGHQAPQAVESRVFVGIAVRGGVERHIRDRIYRASTPNHHLSDSDDLRCDITDAVDADQLSVRFEKNELQKPTTPGDRAAWSNRQVGTADLVIQAALATFVFGQAGSRNFRHAVDGGHGTRVYDA